MKLSEEQMVQVAAAIAGGYASSHDSGAVDVFFSALDELRERTKAAKEQPKPMRVS